MTAQLESIIYDLGQAIKVADAITDTYLPSVSAIEEFCLALAQAVTQVCANTEVLASICDKEGWRTQSDKLEYYRNACVNTTKLLEEMQVAYTAELGPEEYMDTLMGYRDRIEAIPVEYQGRKHSASVDPDVKESQGLEDVLNALEKLFGVIHGKLLRLWHLRKD